MVSIALFLQGKDTAHEDKELGASSSLHAKDIVASDSGQELYVASSLHLVFVF